MSQVDRSERNGSKRTQRAQLRGYSLVELVIVVAIGIVMTAVAIPKVQNAIYRYQLQAAVASSTWAVQSTRYQALSQGYPYEVALTTSNNQYQVLSSPTNNGTYSNVGSAVPFTASAVTLNTNTTFLFKADGYVSAAVGSMSFIITYQGLCQKATVTNYGNITLGAIGTTCS